MPPGASCPDSALYDEMAKKNANNRRKPKAKKSMKKTRALATETSQILAHPKAAAWDLLLRDPCGAPLAHPCYTGMDTGYLIRTTNFVVPSFTTGAAAGPINCDFIVSYTPFNQSATSGYNYAGALSGAAIPAVNGAGFNNFITSAVVKKWRPVACCMKWLPSGPYNTRAGTVASGVSQGTVLQVGDLDTLANVRAAAQRYAPNGSEMHEVRWLPTPVDEFFTDIAASNNGGAGTVFFALQGVDGTSSGTVGSPNGSFEISVVWEWIPAVLGATGTSISPMPPAPFTSQQVLSTISDLSAYVFEGVRKYAGSAMMQFTGQAVNQLLTRGVGVRGGRGPSMPVITY